MNFTFLFFRLKQMSRFFQRTGFGFIILILFLLSGILLQGLSNLLLFSDVIISGVYTVVLISLLFSRTDYLFISNTAQSLYIVYLVDAGLLAIALNLPLILLGRWGAVLLILAPMFTIPLFWTFAVKYLRPLHKAEKGLTFDFSILGVQQFELRYLLRKNGISLGVGYLIALVFCWHPASILVFAFIYLALFQGALEYYEPKEMLFDEGTPQSFLVNKALRLLLPLQLMFLPLYLGNIIFSSGYWYLSILVFFAITMMVLFSVFNKYVFFRPGVKRASTNTIASVMLLFLLFPGFQLVVLLMSIVQYVKAKNNLNIYW